MRLGGHTYRSGQSMRSPARDDARVLFALLDVTPLPLSREKEDLSECVVQCMQVFI